MEKNVPGAIVGHHHNALCVSNLKESLRFYEALGFHESSARGKSPGEHDRKTMLVHPSDPGTCMELYECGGENHTLAEDHKEMAGSWWQFCFEMQAPEDVDRIYEYALSIGGKPRIAPVDVKMYGPRKQMCREAFVFGPDGEIIEFVIYKNLD